MVFYASPEKQTDNLVKFLSDPLVESLLNTHPNQLAYDILHWSKQDIPSSWDCWWEWAALNSDSWSWVATLNDYYHKLLSSSPLHAHEDVPKIRSLLLPNGLVVNPENIPLKLRQLLWDCNRMSLIRKHEECSDCGGTSMGFRKGMSPKKSHEVTHFSSYISDLLKDIKMRFNITIRHIVDVGAGQGYLSRALLDVSSMTQAEAHNIHVLALDSSPQQTLGAERRLNAHTGTAGRQRSQKQNEQGLTGGSLSHKILFVGHDKDEKDDNLKAAVDQWLDQLNTAKPDREEKDKNLHKYPFNHDIAHPPASTPVLFVALHACGSLTPALLRSVMSYRDILYSKPNQAVGGTWYAVGAVVVGCCYNTLKPEDFPLSHQTAHIISIARPPFLINSNHMQIAAQVPSTWCRTSEAFYAASLATRKVVFRAMLEPRLRVLKEHAETENTHTPQARLGKLNNKFYQSFDSFLQAASNKLGVDLSDAALSLLPQDSQSIALDYYSIRRLEVFHVLRCLLGPAIESLILLDRYLWLRNFLDVSEKVLPESPRASCGIALTCGQNMLEYEKRMEFDVKLINIFDQKADSGRNMAIVLVPK